MAVVLLHQTVSLQWCYKFSDNSCLLLDSQYFQKKLSATCKQESVVVLLSFINLRLHFWAILVLYKFARVHAKFYCISLRRHRSVCMKVLRVCFHYFILSLLQHLFNKHEQDSEH